MTLDQLWKIKEEMYQEMERHHQSQVFLRIEDERKAFVDSVRIIEEFYFKAFTQILDNMPN